MLFQWRGGGSSHHGRRVNATDRQGCHMSKAVSHFRAPRSPCHSRPLTLAHRPILIAASHLVLERFLGSIISTPSNHPLSSPDPNPKTPNPKHTASDKTQKSKATRLTWPSAPPFCLRGTQRTQRNATQRTHARACPRPAAVLQKAASQPSAAPSCVVVHRQHLRVSAVQSCVPHNSVMRGHGARLETNCRPPLQMRLSFPNLCQYL